MTELTADPGPGAGAEHARPAAVAADSAAIEGAGDLMAGDVTDQGHPGVHLDERTDIGSCKPTLDGRGRAVLLGDDRANVALATHSP